MRHAFAIPNSDRSPLYDVRNPARASCEGRRVRSDVFADNKLGDRVSPSSPKEGYAGHHASSSSSVAAPRVAEGEAWWSQTGSNRRPHACKARALPAELWPRTRRRMLVACLAVARVSQARLRPSGSGAAAFAALRARRLVGLGRLELPTSRLSSARSNHLSYRPPCHAEQATRAAGGVSQLRRTSPPGKRRRRSPG